MDGRRGVWSADSWDEAGYETRRSVWVRVARQDRTNIEDVEDLPVIRKLPNFDGNQQALPSAVILNCESAGGAEGDEDVAHGVPPETAVQGSPLHSRSR